MDLHSPSLQHTNLPTCLKIINVTKYVSKYMKNHEVERGKKDEWMKCENTCYWWGWTMSDVCLVLPCLNCEHPPWGTQNDKLQQLVLHKTPEKNPNMLLEHRDGYKVSCLPILSIYFFKEKVMAFDIYFCVKKWATVTKMNACEFFFFFNCFTILK